MACRVLLVEDDDDIRQTFARVLELKGHSVIAVSTGTDAIEALAELDELGLILLDLLLPDVDGWAVRKRQLEEGFHPETPVVVISGAAKDLTSAVSALDAADGLTKPISLEQLLGAVQQYCRMPER